VNSNALDPRTRQLLEAPIVPTLLRLGAPNVLIMLAQSAAGLIETFFVGKLGTDVAARRRSSSRVAIKAPLRRASSK
jgi:Na+-driven multidrug efflux pump